MAKGGARQGFEIWQANGRVHSIDSPIRLQLLDALAKAPCTLGDLAQVTGKAKATLSGLHLPELAAMGLVEAATDPHDARVKWFKLVGQRLGNSSVSVPDLREAVLGYVRSTGYVPLAPILAVLRVDLMAKHADDTYVHEVAAALGQLVGRMVPATAPNERKAAIAALLEREGVGRVAWTRRGVQVEGRNAAMEAFVKLVAQAAAEPPVA